MNEIEYNIKDTKRIIENYKRQLKRDYSEFNFLRKEMESLAYKKRSLISESPGKKTIESDIRQLQNNLLIQTGETKERTRAIIEESKAELQKKEEKIKDTQMKLTEAAGKLVEYAKRILGISTDIAVRVVELNLLEREARLGPDMDYNISEQLAFSEIQYFDKCINRIKNSRKLNSFEEQMLSKSSYEFMSPENKYELEQLFEMQDEVINVALSPQIEVNLHDNLASEERNPRSARGYYDAKRKGYIASPDNIKNTKDKKYVIENEGPGE